MAGSFDGSDYQRLFSETPVPTLVIDLDRRTVVDCNEASIELFGSDRDDVLRGAAAELVAEQTGELVVERSARGLSTRSVRRIDTKRGTRTVEVTVLAPTSDGTTFVQVHDVTDLLSTNAALLRHATDLEARTAALETVSSRIAHDLRGPLATIAGFVDLLRDAGSELPEDQHALILERVSANAHTLASMVTEMLDEARRSERGDSGASGVDELFARLHAMFDVEQVDADVRLTTTATVSELPVPVAAVRQVLVNLVDNSIKFRDPDRPLEVLVEVTPVDEATEIVVTDNGSGIDGDPEQLFASGARGRNADGVAGSGLGLAYARQAIEAVGGTLRAEARDPGAAFRILLPHDRPLVTSLPESSFSGGLSPFQLDRILDVAPVPMLLVDLALHAVIRVNVAASSLLGLPAEHIVGRPASDFLEDPAVAQGDRAGVGSPFATVSTLVAGDRRLPAAVWMVGFDDSALLVVQVQDLTGLVDGAV